MLYYDLHDAHENNKRLKFGRMTNTRLPLCKVASTPTWIRLAAKTRAYLHPVSGKPNHYQVEIRKSPKIAPQINFTDDYYQIFRNGTELKITQEDLTIIIESSRLRRIYTYLPLVGFYPTVEREEC